MGGGGIQNQLLTQNASDAIGRDIVAGRDLIKRSNAIKIHHPESAALWKKQLDRFKTVLTKGAES